MKYPEINLMGNGMRVKIITDDVEVIVFSEKGKLSISHVDMSPFEYQAHNLGHTELAKKLEILR